MLTVADLRTHLERMPADTPVYLCSVTPSGVFHDRTCSAVEQVDVDLHPDNGMITGMWLVGTTTQAKPPRMLTVTCSCGEPLVLDDHGEWPEPHRHH